MNVNIMSGIQKLIFVKYLTAKTKLVTHLLGPNLPALIRAILIQTIAKIIFQK
jgi:hypothetical protein